MFEINDWPCFKFSLSAQRTYLLSSPESEIVRVGKDYSSRWVPLRNSVSFQWLYVVIKFDGRSLSKKGWEITYGCPFGRVSSDFLKLDKVVTSYQTGS